MNARSGNAPVRLLLFILLAGAVWSGCPCPGPDTLLEEDWEGCAGLCSWTLVAGEAERVATVHPGEHGCRLGAGARIERTPLREMIQGLGAAEGWSCPGSAAGLRAACTRYHDIGVELTAGCSAGLEVHLELGLQDGSSEVVILSLRDGTHPDAPYRRLEEHLEQAGYTELRGVAIESALDCAIDDLLILGPS